MKLKVLGIAALCAIALTACDGSKNPYREVKLDKQTSADDSLGYLIGEMAAFEQINMAQQDTTMAGPAAKESYEDGFLAGMRALKDGDDAYNRGLQAGIMYGSQLEMMNKQTGLNVQKGAVFSGFQTALKADSVDQKKAQDIQTTAVNILNNATQKKAKEAINAYIKGKNYTKSGDNYFRVAKKGTGAKLTKGETVTATASIKDQKGKELFPSQPMPAVVGVGQLPPFLEDKIMMMDMGSTYDFIITANDFQGQTPPGMNPGEVYIMTIQLSPAQQQAPNALPGGAPANATVDAAPAQTAPVADPVGK